MSRFSLRKNRALVSGILSACYCPLAQQYVRAAGGREDAVQLLKHVREDLFLFDKDYKDKNNYSLLATGKRGYLSDRGTSFEERAKKCCNYVFSYDEKEKSDITCWTSSLALIYHINSWYEDRYWSGLPGNRPRFHLGFFSYPIRFTRGLVNHTGVCVILGQYCLLFDPIVGKASDVIDLEDDKEIILATLLSFFDANITRIYSEEKEPEGLLGIVKNEIGNLRNKVTDFFAGALDVPAEKREILLSENYITSKNKKLGDLRFAECRGFLLQYTKTLDEDISQMFNKQPASTLFQYL